MQPLRRGDGETLERQAQLGRHARRYGCPICPPHARHPLPASGNEFLRPVADAHVVEGEADLSLGELLQAHSDGQLVERRDLGQVLAFGLDGEQLELTTKLIEHAGRVLEQEHLPAPALPAHIVDVIDVPHQVGLLEANHVAIFVILIHYRRLPSGS